MKTLSKLDQIMKEAAFDIAVKHLLRNKKKSPEKTAAHVLRLCSEWNGSTLSKEEIEAFYQTLLPLLNMSDEGSICIWLKDQILSSK